jgi:hypothetical protein
LGQWFLQMPLPIIVVIIATIAIAKFSELARRPGHRAGSFFLVRKVLPAWSVFEA